MIRWQSFICPVCLELMRPETDEKESVHVHHLIPKHKGGPDTYENLLVCHADCHRTAHKKKRSKTTLKNNLNSVLNLTVSPDKE